ncbi:MAG TPA: DUF4382 domain-containing protein, partial [Polyangia bacterium]|nr:DUF4382 domain-containing protein [Polyangia bacterium]
SGKRTTGPIVLRLAARTEMAVKGAPAPTPSLSQVVVTIDRISAKVADMDWQTVLQKTETVDLMTLKGGSFAVLGITQLPAGHVTELRLHLAAAGPNYVVTSDGVRHDLTIPSGDESGIKIGAGFDLEECARGSITFNFSGDISIEAHPTGNGQDWILRPVVRLLSVEHTATEADCEDADERGEADDKGRDQAEQCTNVLCVAPQFCDDGTCRATETD